MQRKPWHSSLHLDWFRTKTGLLGDRGKDAFPDEFPRQRGSGSAHIEYICLTIYLIYLMWPFQIQFMTVEIDEAPNKCLCCPYFGIECAQMKLSGLVHPHYRNFLSIESII